MDIPEIRTLAAVAGLDRALDLFPDEVARAVALVRAQRLVLRAESAHSGEGLTSTRPATDPAAT